MKKHLTKLLIILIFFSFPFLFYRPAYAKPTVAVLWFENRTLDRSLNYLNQLIPDLITTKLSKLEFCTILEREEIENALNEILLSEEGFISPRERIRKGMVETADYLLSGDFTKKGEDLIISVRLYNWKKGFSETIDFCYPLSEIKGAGEDIVNYLQKEIKGKTEKGIEQAILESDLAVTIFFEKYLNPKDPAVYAYPYGIIFLKELKNDLKSNGIDCTIITELNKWEKILKGSTLPSRKLYHIYIDAPDNFATIPPPSAKVIIYDFGSSEKPLNWEKAERKEFSAPLSHFTSLQKEVAKYILSSLERESLMEEVSSPEMESLVYYGNYLRQSGYSDSKAAFNEILKSLYLYPDFSFYWWVLNGIYRCLDKPEKTMKAQEVYLSLSSWKEHRLIYEDTLCEYIEKLGNKRVFTSQHASFVIPLMEEIIKESQITKWQKTEMAVLLCRIYLLSDKVEKSKFKNLRDKDFISNEEFQSDLCLSFLIERLNFTKKEKVYLVNALLEYFADISNYTYLHFMYLPSSLIQRFENSKNKQKEFLSIMRESTKRYPSARTNFYIFKHSTKKFDQNLVRAELGKIERESSDSLLAYYSKLIKLEEKFLSEEGDKEKLAEEIAEIAFGPLSNLKILNDKWMPVSFLEECIKKGIDERNLFYIFSEFIKREKFSKRIYLIKMAPENLQPRLETTFGLKQPEEKEKEKRKEPTLSLGEKNGPKALLSSNLKGLAEIIAEAGWNIKIFFKEKDLNKTGNYKLIILRLNDIAFYSERWDLRIDILNQIIQNLNEGIFILIVPHERELQASLIPQLSSFLSQFNCYIDDKKEITSEAILSPSELKDAIAYHSSLKVSSGIHRRWERFFIRGYPIYSEKGKVLIKSSEENYPLAISLSLPNGDFIISGDMELFWGASLAPTSRCFYEELISHNIWRILLAEISEEKPILTPVPLIEKFYKVHWKIYQISESYLYLEPFLPWLNKDEIYSMFLKSLTQQIEAIPSIIKEGREAISIYEEILKESSDSYIQTHCLYCLGIINRFLGKNKEAAYHFAKMKEGLSKHRDRSEVFILLIDTLLRKEIFGNKDYKFCCKHLDEEIEQFSPLVFYDLKGRLNERIKDYKKAISAYEEMVNFLFKTTYGAQRRFFEYAYFRRASLFYQSCDFKEAEKSFLELIDLISREWNLKPDTWDENSFYSTGNTIPSPFKMKAASYFYLREIAEKEGKRFLYQQQLADFIETIQKRAVNKGKEFKELVFQIQKIAKQENLNK